MSDVTDVTALIVCMTDNERPFIEETICSALAQTHPCELVVLLNDASKKFDGLEEKYPSARFVRTKIRPPGAMRNFGMNYVNTNWVAFLDGDDLWRPRKIELQLAEACMGGGQLIGCDYRLISETGKPFAHALSHVIAAPSSWFAAAETMRKHKFPEEPLVAEDVKWWNDYAKDGGVIKAQRIAKFLVDYRVRGSSLSEGSIPGRRKRLVKKLAFSIPGARLFLLMITWIAHFMLRSSAYKASQR